MDYEQKLHALNALAECSVKMRKPGDWYVEQPTEIKDGPDLVGRYGNGSTPQEAIVEHWDALTVLLPGQYVVVGAYRDDRKAVRWNGFMWDHVQEQSTDQENRDG